MTDEFVLIPKSLYLQLIDSQTPLIEKVLDNSTGYSSQMVGALPPPPPPRAPLPPIRPPRVGSHLSEDTLPPPTTSETDVYDQIIDDVHLTGIALERSKEILRLMIRNNRVDISQHRTILLDGIDTSLPVTTVLFNLQKHSKIPPPVLDIVRVLQIPPELLINPDAKRASHWEMYS